MIDKNKHIDSDHLMGKYLSGEAVPEEIRWLEKWVLKAEENKKRFNAIRQTWALTNKTIKASDINIDAEWSKLQSRMDEFDNSKVIAFTEKRKSFIGFKIAAAVVVLISLSFVLYYLFSGSNTEQIVAHESIEVKTLPDGSQVTLNHHTKLSYAIKNSEDKRVVKLEGEAFFDVEQDTKRPFIIETDLAKVEVLGTSFSVNSRKENSVIEVVVETGKVAFKAQGNQIDLVRGQKGIFEKETGKFRKEINTDVNYNSWKTRRMVFENSKLAYVFDKIGQIYHVDLKVSNSEINACMITATFDQQPLEAVLNILEETLDLEIENQGSVIVISGEGCNPPQ